jgi:outer membrane protein
MKRLLLSIFTMIALTVSAQEVVSGFRFGYLSYEAALQAMPEYAVVQKKMADLRQQFQAETLRVEDEFNRKYEEFLEGQREFPKTILQKRQTELQELMERNIKFKENSQEELSNTEKSLMAPLKIRLIETIGKIGRDRGYAFIVDTDNQALPFINPAMGDDVTQLVQNALK